MKKLLKLVLIVGGIAAVAKMVGAKKAQWEGLTESEVRAKLDAKLPNRMPADKQAQVADKVVAKMRARGVIVEDEPVPEADGNGGVAVATGEADPGEADPDEADPDEADPDEANPDENRAEDDSEGAEQESS